MGRVAVLQMDADIAVPGYRMALIDDAARRAAAAGAALLVAPELALSGYGGGAALRASAQPADGEHVARLIEIARAARLVIVAGFAERAAGGLHNSAVAVGPDGLRGLHRKSALDNAYERALFAPAAPSETILWAGGLRVAVLICFELESRARTQGLAARGVDVVAAPVALTADAGGEAVLAAAADVAADARLPVALANLAGEDGAFRYAGRSTILGGGPVAALGARGGGLVVADVDARAHAAAARA